MMGDRVRSREILQQLLSRQPLNAAAKRGLAELVER